MQFGLDNKFEFTVQWEQDSAHMLFGLSNKFELQYSASRTCAHMLFGLHNNFFYNTVMGSILPICSKHDEVLTIVTRITVM
jgi:hypothetical protein